MADRAKFAGDVRQAISSGEIAGAVAAMSTPKRVLIEALGSSRQHPPVPMDVDTIFRIGSCAKAFFAAAGLALFRARGIGLDDKVERWLPELADRTVLRRPDSPLDDTVPAHRAITVRDVVTFQLGIGMYLAQYDTPIFRAMREHGVAPQTEPVELTPDEFIARIGALPLAHQPGETFMYHLGDDVLRILMSRITGQPLHEVLREFLFDPLGMDDTGCSVPHAKLHRFSTCYFTGSSPDIPLEVWDEADGRFAEEPVFPNQIMTTARDFLAFTDMLLAEGRHRDRPILDAATVRMMMTDHLTPEMKARSPAPDGFWRDRGWGIGATVYARSIPGGAGAGSYSWFGGYGPHFLVDPTRRSSVILLVPRVTRAYADTQLGYRFEEDTYRNFLADE